MPEEVPKLAVAEAHMLQMVLALVKKMGLLLQCCPMAIRQSEGDLMDPHREMHPQPKAKGLLVQVRLPGRIRNQRRL